MEDAAEDEDFCSRMLPRVSRTFAVGIAALPSTLRGPLTVGYLLCRAADAIEDQTSLPLAARRASLDAFRAEVLSAARRAHAAPLGVPPSLLRALPPPSASGAWASGVVGTSAADTELLEGRAHVLRQLAQLPADVASLVAATAAEMAAGMGEYLQDETTRPIATWGDLERYCYFVAGTVGHMLTGLFLAGRPPYAGEAALVRRATAFGTGLQLVNIAKDAARDLGEGRCFLPREAWPPGFLARSSEPPPPALDAAVRAIVERGWAHLREAEVYLVTLPPDALEARRFCAMALHLAVLTLRACDEASTLLDQAHPPKVSRLDVTTTVAWLALHAGDDAALDARFASLAGSRARAG